MSEGIRIHSTLTRRKEPLVPGPGGVVRIYVCGPTVYGRIHIGNARPFVVFSVLKRFLQRAGLAVRLVSNLTDVNDKIYDAARAEGVPSDELARRYSEAYIADTDRLELGRPDAEPRVTDSIPAIIEMIEALVERGLAYPSGGDVYFRVERFPRYGRLSGRRLDELEPQEPGPAKESPHDFALWKGRKEDEDTWWESPWGPGRPGWHIECSAMAGKLLGHPIDIHCGGMDLIFPHHENEIAQSRCADPHEGFAQVWMHNEMLLVDGRKMSKSLGNFFTVRDLLDQDVPGEVIRLVLLGTHYRSPMDWTAERVSEARTRLTRWFRKTDGVASSPTLTSRFEALLSDDLNIPAALGAMETLPPPFLKAAMRQLGLPDAEHVDWFRSVQVQMTGAAAQVSAPSLGSELAPYLRHWQALRDKRDYAAADAFKAKLEGVGLRLRIVGDAPMADIPSGFRIEDLADVAPEVFR